MYKLIDANELSEKLQKKSCGPANVRYTEGFNDCLMKVRSMIHGAPTICVSEEGIDNILKGVNKSYSFEGK